MLCLARLFVYLALSPLRQRTFAFVKVRNKRRKETPTKTSLFPNADQWLTFAEAVWPFVVLHQVGNAESFPLSFALIIINSVTELSCIHKMTLVDERAYRKICARLIFGG